MKLIHPTFLLLALAPAATAQLVPVYVTDSTSDGVWRCNDLNGDGDYDDVGEVADFYNDALGGLSLTNNVGVVSRPDGTVYVCDTTEDKVFAFRDTNADGDANDLGEYRVFFDGQLGGNASGVVMPSASKLVFDDVNGAWYVVSANTGATGNDSVIRLVDFNSDGDANDLGEASDYWTFPGSPGGDSVPQGIEIGLDGNVYIVDSPSSGPNGKGAYRLVDLNMDGDALDPGERTAFFIPPFTATPFYWCLELGNDGWFYIADTGNDVVWRFRDLNMDGDAQDPGESFAWWTVGGTSNIWDLAAAADGSIYASDSMPVQRIWRLLDANGDGVIGAGEFTAVYDETFSPTTIGNGRGIDIAREASVGTAFCFGDGSGTACPCANESAPGNNAGCLHSLGMGGKLLTTGSASIANDTLALVGTQMPNSSALYFQGTAQQSGGAGIVFGDGLRCVGGTVIRLGTKFNVAGGSVYPTAGDASVSVRGLDSASDTRVYQAWFRNAASFCTAGTFNLSNGISLTWAP